MLNINLKFSLKQDPDYRSWHYISAYMKQNFKFLDSFRVICLCSLRGPRQSKFPLSLGPGGRGGVGPNLGPYLFYWTVDEATC